jgi:malic enzyme
MQLIQDHLKEMFSIIYTPTEGDAIQNFSRLFRRPEGCFLNIDDQGRVYHDLAQWGNPEDIDYIVVTGNLNPEHVALPSLTLLNRWRGNPWYVAASIAR